LGKEPVRLGGLIERLVTSLGQADKYHGWQTVARWKEIVGPETARHCRAIRFSEGILTVVVEKDVWRQELEMQLDDILAKIWSKPGGRAVTKIVLRAGSPMEYNDES